MTKAELLALVKALRSEVSDVRVMNHDLEAEIHRLRSLVGDYRRCVEIIPDSNDDPTPVIYLEELMAANRILRSGGQIQ